MLAPVGPEHAPSACSGGAIQRPAPPLWSPALLSFGFPCEPALWVSRVCELDPQGRLVANITSHLWTLPCGQRPDEVHPRVSL